MRLILFLSFSLFLLLASENDQNALNLTKMSLGRSKMELALKAVQDDSVKQLKAIGQIERSEGADLLKKAYGFGSKQIAALLTMFVKPTVEESVGLVSEAVRGGQFELAKSLLKGRDLSQNVENTIGLACLTGHPLTVNFVLSTYKRTPYTIFELLVEAALSSDDSSSYYMALENFLEACPDAGLGYNGQPFFFASLKHGKYQLASLLFRACTVDVTYLEPFIITDSVGMAGRFLSVLLDEQVKLARALFIAVKSNHPRSFADLMEWARANKPCLLDQSFAIKTVRMLGSKLDSSIASNSKFCWMEFFEILVSFEHLSLYEKEAIMIESGFTEMASLLGLMKAYYALLRMGEGDFWLPRDLISKLVSSNI